MLPAALLCLLFAGCAARRPAAAPQPGEQEHLAVVIEADQTDGPAPLTVHFKSNTLERKDITDFQWDFGDGTSSTRKDPSHTYDKPGDYTVKLRAVSPTGFSDWDWEAISVEAPDDESAGGY